MDAINRVRFNGKDYKLSAEGAEVVRELDGLGDGNTDIIFVGVMDDKDVDRVFSYHYFNTLLDEDNSNNKVFEATTLPITVRTKYECVTGKHPFILVPQQHPNLYMLSTPSQQFTGWDEEYKEVMIDFPSGVKPYKLFIFGNNLFRINLPITYTF